ncbi:hypothetical protein ILYODFUR_004201 [Ilyodon furcidens]|uniref:Uncharacterized protein n=1 Tax=Ilyodon furcidens TaxID=33524 RepID=A0ABV0TUG7_9TELE
MQAVMRSSVGGGGPVRMFVMLQLTSLSERSYNSWPSSHLILYFLHSAALMPSSASKQITSLKEQKK